MNSKYGYCPKCGYENVERERRPNGNDKCEKGHSYPSNNSVEDESEAMKIRIRVAILEKLN